MVKGYGFGLIGKIVGQRSRVTLRPLQQKTPVRSRGRSKRSLAAPIKLGSGRQANDMILQLELRVKARWVNSATPKLDADPISSAAVANGAAKTDAASAAAATIPYLDPNWSPYGQFVLFRRPSSPTRRGARITSINCQRLALPRYGRAQPFSSSLEWLTVSYLALAYSAIFRRGERPSMQIDAIHSSARVLSSAYVE